MFFSWYQADYRTDPDFEDKDPERKANPSMDSWNNPGYLESQRKRLPSHKFRRLHLNLPGMPEGAYFDAESWVFFLTKVSIDTIRYLWKGRDTVN